MMTSDLQIIAAAFKQGAGGVPLLCKSINAGKEMKILEEPCSRVGQTGSCEQQHVRGSAEPES